MIKSDGKMFVLDEKEWNLALNAVGDYPSRRTHTPRRVPQGSNVCKHWFRWGNRFSWTRPINHNTLATTIMAPSLTPFCWIQNYTRKCHEVKLLQFVILFLAVNNIVAHFARSSS
jgi:hypothetical protein